MKKSRLIGILLFGYLAMFLCDAGIARAEWRFPIHLNYVSGFKDVYDEYVNTMSQEYNRSYDGFYFPVGLSFQPYYEFEFGLRFGGGIGPFAILVGDENYFCLPVNLNVGYTIIPYSDISPYVRAGITYPFATGGYVEGASVGFLGAAGLEFRRYDNFRFGFELGVDTSEIDIRTYNRATRRYGMTSVNPIGFFGSIFISF